MKDSKLRIAADLSLSISIDPVLAHALDWLRSDGAGNSMGEIAGNAVVHLVATLAADGFTVEATGDPEKDWAALTAASDKSDRYNVSMAIMAFYAHRSP